MARIDVTLGVVPGLSTGSLSGENVQGNSVHATQGDTIVFALLDREAQGEPVVQPLTFPNPAVAWPDTMSASCFVVNPSADREHVSISVEDQAVPGRYDLTFNGWGNVPMGTFTIVVSGEIEVVVHHDHDACTLTGPTVTPSGSDYTVHAGQGDTVRFKLTSCDPKVTFDDPPLNWTSPDTGMSVTRLSDTEFTVVDNGRQGGQFDFKLDVDTFTITGRVHCKDDPSILNDNPP